MSEHQVDHSLCGASGCPLIGVRSSNTKRTTGDPWYCFIHVAADPDDWYGITGELNRLGWLAEAVKAIRANAPAKKLAEVNRNIGLAMRKDLLRKEYESMLQWSIRLEQVLAESCASAIGKQEEVIP